ncbi:MAG: cyclase dehydrase [Micavibrio sp.]|nr:cyclase dehydrase [Micavibrio sp.]
MLLKRPKSRILHSTIPVDRVARGLGWFSLGLGLTELVAPGILARSLGAKKEKTGAAIVRGYGGREIVAGLAILGSANPAPGVWARVAGDSLDLGTLAVSAARNPANRRNALLAIAMVAGITMIDLACAGKLTLARRKTKQPVLPLDEYRSRSGFPKPIEEMRGIAIGDDSNLSYYANGYH